MKELSIFFKNTVPSLLKITKKKKKKPNRLDIKQFLVLLHDWVRNMKHVLGTD